MEYVEIIPLGIVAGFALTAIPFVVGRAIGGLFAITQYGFEGEFEK